MIDGKAKLLLETNRKLIDYFKKEHPIKFRNNDLFEILDTDLISFVLMDHFLYAKDGIYKPVKYLVKVLLSIVFNRSKQRFIKLRLDGLKKDKFKIGIIITNKKQSDIYYAIKNEICNFKDLTLISLCINNNFKVKGNLSFCLDDFLTLSGFLSSYFTLYNLIKNYKITIPEDIIDSYVQLKGEDRVSLKKKLKLFLNSYLRNAIVTISKYLTIACNFQTNANLHALLTTNERELISKVNIVGFRMKGLKKIYGLQRGVILDHPEVGDVLVDKMFVDGNWYKKNLIKRGCPEEKIEIIGSPRLDSLLNCNSAKGDYIRSMFGIEKNHKVFLVITEVRALGVTEQDQEEFLQKALSNIKLIDNSFIIIKAHPNQKDFRLEARVAKKLLNSTRYKICRTINVFDLLLVADFVITEFSTVATEALAVQLPVLIPSFKKNSFDDLLGIRSSNLVFAFSNIRELHSIMENLSKVEISEKFVQDYYYKLDGRSTRRLLEYVTMN